MKLIVTGSSSAGNGYILQASDNRSLLLEAGVPFSTTKKALGYRVSQIDACFITHEHGDHARRADEILAQSIAPVFASKGTIEAIEEARRRQGRNTPRRPMTPCQPMDIIKAGAFQVIPTLLAIEDGGKQAITHDAAEPLCFQIYHPEMGIALFATDTYTLPCRFTLVNHVMIECNYDAATLDRLTQAGRIDHRRRERTIQSHMSLDNCKRQLTTNIDLAYVQDITLLHLSDTNGDPERFADEIQRETGKPTRVATAGAVFEFNKERF